MEQRFSRSVWDTRIVQFALFLMLTALLGGCANGAFKPREVCLEVEASPSLNLYDGQAHALNLFFYPLTGPAAFQEASIEDLVSGRQIDGSAGPPISLMMSPSEVKEMREAFPPSTAFIGVVANFYQPGLETPGNRRALVNGKCSLFGSEKIMLTARDLTVE